MRWNKDLNCLTIFLTKNKTFEIQFDRYDSQIFNLVIQQSFKEDHAGFHFELYLFTYGFYISIRDNRHWDYKNKCWEKN